MLMNASVDRFNPSCARQSCNIVHFNSALPYEALVVLDILDRIREGFFDAVFLFLLQLHGPELVTSKAALLFHYDEGLNLQAWTRSARMDSVQVVEGNEDIEVSCWFAEQAFRCKPYEAKKVHDPWGGCEGVERC